MYNIATMQTFLFLCAVLLYAMLVWSRSVSPHRAQLSAYERRHRKHADVETATLDISREETYAHIRGVIRLLEMLLLVLFVLVSLTAFEWLSGSIAVIVGLVLLEPIARMAPIHQAAQRLYDKFEPKILGYATQYQGFLRFFRTVEQSPVSSAPIASKDELLHVIDHLPNILDKDERRLIHRGLAFSSVEVRDVMTPRSVIDSVKKDDVVGPLMLDELHKTGHSRFPVVDGDIDHVVGVLYIYNLLQLHDKKTHKASSLMTTPVYYIKESQTLDHALAAFLKTHHHILIVVNEYRETVGLLTLEDTIENLLGRKIVDEFDMHEDLRAVAVRNPRGNNQPDEHKDI